ncbi:MAG: SdpI family protein [Ferruginibacter sp.]
MKKRNTELLIWIVIIIPFVAAFSLWDKIPNQLSVHINSNKVPGKLQAVLTLPVINLLIYVVLTGTLKFAINKNQLSLFADRIGMIRLAIHSCLSALFLIILFYTLNNDLNVFILLAYTFLITFLVMGNYFNAIKPNRFFGIRLPWTLSSETVWRKTHFVTARVWVFSSLVMMLVIPFLQQLLVATLFVIYFLLIMLLPITYSFIISKRQSL